MQTIPLTQGLVAFVDDEDYDPLATFKWHAAWAPTTRNYYAATNLRVRPGKQITITMHRLILHFPHSPVDHRSGDTLDNRKCNLRLATSAQNSQNSKLRRTNKSGLKGVYFNSKNGKWRTEIRAAGKRRFLGDFDTTEEAHEAYKRAAIEMHREFARF